MTQSIANVRKIFFKRLIVNAVIIIFFLIALGVGLTLVGMFNVFLFLLLGFIPSIIVCILNIKKGRALMKVVFALNIAGVLPSLASIIFSGSPSQTALSITQSYGNFILPYGFSAFGLCMAMFIPYVVQIYMEIRAKYIIKKIEGFQDVLVEEWGDKVKE